MKVGTHRSLVGAVMSVVAVAGCSSGSPPPTASPAPSIEAPSPTPTAVAATPSLVRATLPPIPSVAIAELPPVELAEIDATALCDPYPSQATIEAGESAIFCSDGLELALAVVRTVTLDPVTRLYLRRPRCAAIPCSEDELSTAEVTAWTATQALSVQLDSRLETVPQPSVGNDAVWPAAGSEPVPTVWRESIEGAPREVADRNPYPFCGRAEVGEPPAVQGCFRDAVLAGRTAEMIERGYGTEGGEQLRIYRNDGRRRLISFQHDQTVGGDGRVEDSWRRSEGAMILAITPPLAWDFEPWWGTEQKL